ncbi:protein decapentaplegic-like isoform X2 [Corticium candelabrum]|nr:protein decapentaplegic-like isoform X2 [Corticium candelabrum]
MDGKALLLLLFYCTLFVNGETSDGAKNDGLLSTLLTEFLEFVGVPMPRKKVPVDGEMVQYMLKLYNAHQDYLEGRSMKSPLLFDDETVWGIPTISAKGSSAVDGRNNGRLRLAVELSGLDRTTSSELTRASLRISWNWMENCRLRVTFYGRVGHHAGWRKIDAGAVLRPERSGSRIEVDVKNLVGSWLRNRRRHHYDSVIVDVDPVDCDDDRLIADSNEPFLVVFASPRHDPLPRAGSRRRSERSARSTTKRSGGCELLPMVVDFTERGWNTWIIAPRQYDAGFCNGSCVSHRVRGFTPHAKAIAHAQLSLPYKLGAPTCAPSKLQGRSILYKHPDGTVTVKTLKGMVCKSCECR